MNDVKVSAEGPEAIEDADDMVEQYQAVMSLRDYFAGQALTGMFACGGHRDVAAGIAEDKHAFCLTPTEIGEAAEERIAAMAYSMADAMLAERERQ